MIKVLDKLYNNQCNILICELFSDDIVTNKLMSNVENYDVFEVADPFRCFSEPKSRIIALPSKYDVKNVKFVNFI